MGPDAMILVFWMLTFKPIFPLSSFPLIKSLFSSTSWKCHLAISHMSLKTQNQLQFLLPLLFLLLFYSSIPNFCWKTCLVKLHLLLPNLKRTKQLTCVERMLSLNVPNVEFLGCQTDMRAQVGLGGAPSSIHYHPLSFGDTETEFCQVLLKNICQPLLLTFIIMMFNIIPCGLLWWSFLH